MESPGALASIREGNICIGIPGGNDGLASVIKDLATELLVLDERANLQLDSLKWPHGSNRWLVLTLVPGENGLRASLGSLVAEDDADLVGVGADLLECRIADDVADHGLVTEGPGAFAAVAEGDVCVIAAFEDNGRFGMVEDLAAVVLVLDVWAEGELDCLEGPRCGGRLRGANTFGEFVLSTSFAEVA